MRVPKRLLLPWRLPSPRRLRQRARQKIARAVNLHSAPIRFPAPRPLLLQDRRVVNLAAKQSANPFASRVLRSAPEGASSTTSATLCKKSKTFYNANALLPAMSRSAIVPRVPKRDAAPKKNSSVGDVADAVGAAVVAVDPAKAIARKGIVRRAIPPDRTQAGRRSRVANP